MSNDEIEELQRKAKRYDELKAIVDNFYEMDDNGEFTKEDVGLDLIGEAVAHYFGYI